MKINLKTAISAALLATGAAYAQTPVSVTVPFEFRAFESQMPAGEYDIRPLDPGLKSMELRNVATGYTVYIPTRENPAMDRTSTRARMVFDCKGNKECALESVWTGLGTGVRIPVKNKRD